MRDGPRIVAVVAAKDRADSVGATVTALLAVPAVDEVLVVDDGSTDATAQVARRAGAWVLRLPDNRGKGGAVAAAVAATPETDVYLLVDADTGASAAAAAALLPPVLDGEADMTVAVLPSPGGRGGFGLVRDLAAAGIRRGTSGFRATAPLSGQRAVRGPLLRSLDPAPRFGLEVGLTVDAIRAGARVAEVPVAMDHRHTGRSLAGFTHRARQGADVARALWPRLTSARARVCLVGLGLVLVLVASVWSGGRSQPSSVGPTSPANKVLLVGVPGLAWHEVGTGAMPNVDRLLDRGALAAMSVRTGSGVPTVGEGYAALGAGSRVHAGEAADDAVIRDGRVVVPGVARLRDGAGEHLPTLPGALGQALHDAGRRTAVVGNADLAPGLAGLGLSGVPGPSGPLSGVPGPSGPLSGVPGPSGPLSGVAAPPGHPTVSRPTGVALMDRDGVVDAGSVDPEELLVADGLAPFGRRADLSAMSNRVGAALASADVVLVDTGDFDRAAALRHLGAPDWFVAGKRAQALAAADELIGRISAGMPAGTLLLVLSVVPPTDEWRLAPVVAAGAGVVHGYLHSPSTRRLGLVALTDLAPTVLASLGAPVPAEMVGAPLRYHPGAPDVGRLARLDRDAVYRERIWLPVAVGFVAVQVGLWALTGLAVAGRAPWAPKRWLRAAALAVAAFPLATFVFRALPNVALLGTAGLAVLAALDLAIVALALRARRHPLAPLAWILGATAALIVLDVVTGARLQVGAILGYSPHTAYRFSGLGNTAFAALAASSVLAAALHVQHAPRRREALVAVSAFLALVAFVDGAPSLGEDVGGILTLVPVFGLALFALAGRRMSWRLVVAAAAAAVVVLALATAVDLLRPPDARTHLGRLAGGTLDDGGSSLVSTIERKASVNLRILRQSVVMPMVLLIAVALLVVLLRQGPSGPLSGVAGPSGPLSGGQGPSGPLSGGQGPSGPLSGVAGPSGPLSGGLAFRGSAIRVGLVSALAAGLLGFAVNDSGVIVTAIVLVEVGPMVALLALGERPSPTVLLEPGGDDATEGPGSSLAAQSAPGLQTR